MAAMRLPPKVKFFLSNPILRDLPHEDLHALVRVVEDRELGRGEAIWQPDDLADSVFGGTAARSVWRGPPGGDER